MFRFRFDGVMQNRVSTTILRAEYRWKDLLRPLDGCAKYTLHNLLQLPNTAHYILDSFSIHFPAKQETKVSFQ